MSAAGSSRTVAVPAERLPAWTAGFVARHGTAAFERDGAGWRLRGADGATALLRAPFGWTDAAPGRSEPRGETAPVGAGGGAAADAGAAGTLDGVEALAVRLAADAAAVPRCAVIVVRRAGYLCAVVDGGEVVDSKVGRRHVQGRTAAGGWSQQRFARRRAKQADELVDAATEAAVRVLVPCLPLPALATGGDRALVADVLGDPRLRLLRDVTRTASLAIGTPERASVDALPRLLSTLSVVVTDAAAAAT